MEGVSQGRDRVPLEPWQIGDVGHYGWSMLEGRFKERLSFSGEIIDRFQWVLSRVIRRIFVEKIGFNAP